MIPVAGLVGGKVGIIVAKRVDIAAEVVGEGTMVVGIGLLVGEGEIVIVGGGSDSD